MPRHRGVKRPTGSAVREPLSYALGTRAKVACLRILALTRQPITQRELARRAHLQHRSVQLALDELVALALVSRIEGGRDFLVSLNSAHRLAQPLGELFRREADHFLDLRSSIVDLAGAGPRRGRPLAVVLFGSAARGADDAESDLDVLLIAPDEATRTTVLDRIQERAEEIRRRFGVRVKPVGYTVSEAHRLWRERGSPLQEVAQDGLVLSGTRIAELLR